MSNQSEFITTVDSFYRVGLDGTISVQNKITLENVYSELYATSYSMVTDGLNPYDIVATQDGRTLKTIVAKDGTKISIKVQFDDEVVGKGKRRVFELSYKDKSLAVKTGEVWEILIPRIDSSGFNNYQVNLIVPGQLGEEAYISPEPSSRSSSDGQLHYVFDKELIAKSGVSAAFGKFQVFSFDITYHLENPLSKYSEVEIAIPPDTSFQRVSYQSLEPKPQNVRVDEDGNWIALFKLKPRQRLDVKTKGAVQIFSEGRVMPAQTQDLTKSLAPTEVWQTTDPGILLLAQKLKTPRAIYDYVVSTLSYNYDRVQPNVTRLGAKQALADPGSAICMEFTDTFIAIARAAGIPAREVNGYAYTENPQIQPLSLVADVLHAWPEYWDYEKSIWVPVDPTWEQTSGVDFFSKLDLRHFAFVMHGSDPFKPYPPGSYKLGANPQKDVFVSFGSLPENRSTHPEIAARGNGGMFLSPLTYNITVSNAGPAALYNQTLNVSIDEKNNQAFQVQALLPYSTRNYKYVPKYGFMGNDLPKTFNVTLANTEVEVVTHKTNIIISNLAIILTILLVATIALYLKLKDLYERKIADKKNITKNA
ncbi:MAG: transglutaminase domain-containing protein [Patescibacteria group bacterium]